MHTIKSLLVVSMLCLGSALPLVAPAQTHHDSHGDMTEHTDASMTNGEVRKVDLDAGKVTIKHEEIKHMQMPAMTMVLNARDKAMLSNLKPGDKISFMAVREGTKVVITKIVPRP